MRTHLALANKSDVRETIHIGHSFPLVVFVRLYFTILTKVSLDLPDVDRKARRVSDAHFQIRRRKPFGRRVGADK